MGFNSHFRLFCISWTQVDSLEILSHSCLSFQQSWKFKEISFFLIWTFFIYYIIYIFWFIGKYIHILEEELGISNLSDWYRVSYDNIKSVGISDSQIKKLTFSKILEEIYPDHDWDMAKLRLSGAKMATQRLIKVLLKK